MPRRRRGFRRPEREPEQPPPGAWAEGWYRCCEFYDGMLPHPTSLTQAEGDGSLEMSMVRIPAMIVYFPLYYLFFGVFVLLAYPWMVLAAAIAPRR